MYAYITLHPCVRGHLQRHAGVGLYTCIYVYMYMHIYIYIYLFILLYLLVVDTAKVSITCNSFTCICCHSFTPRMLQVCLPASR